MADVQIKRIAVASPVDVQAECDVLPAVIAELNNGIARDRELRLQLVRWETDAYPAFYPEGTEGFLLLPKPWIVERTFGWLSRYRRLAKDSEYLPQTSDAMIRVAMIHLIVRRLARMPSF